MFTKSIRWRLQLWQAFLLVCILIGFGVTAYQLNRTNRLSQIDAELEHRLSALSGDVRGRPPFGPPPGRPPFASAEDAPKERMPLGPPPEHPPFEPGHDSPFPRRPEPDSRAPRGRMEDFLETREIRLAPRTLSLFDQTETNDFYFAIWTRGGNLLKRSTNAPADLSLPVRLDALTGIHPRLREANREAYQFTEIGECVLVGRSIASDLRATQRFALWLITAGGAVLVIGLGGGWWVAGRALRPVEDISAAASRISAGRLSERIDVADTDSELGRLAAVLNSTFARLEAAFAQQKQFTADASHELRTPIAVIISEAQTTLARERTAAEYRETVGVCLDTAQQMRRLTQSLLELARYDAGQESIERRPVNLAERMRAGIELVRPLARERGIQIHSNLVPAEALGDADRLDQVITNLLANAVHYNRPNGEIRVSVLPENGAVILTVADTGQGIAPEDLPPICGRFYRADKARSRANGHSGLGLAICQAIVDAHGGSLEVASQLGVGTTVTLRLPSPLDKIPPPP